MIGVAANKPTSNSDLNIPEKSLFINSVRHVYKNLVIELKRMLTVSGVVML